MSYIRKIWKLRRKQVIVKKLLTTSKTSMKIFCKIKKIQLFCQNILVLENMKHKSENII